MLFEFNTNIYDNKSDETFEIDEGFVKGNLFKDEYIGYKEIYTLHLIPIAKKNMKCLQNIL